MVPKGVIMPVNQSPKAAFNPYLKLPRERKPDSELMTMSRIALDLGSRADKARDPIAHRAAARLHLVAAQEAKQQGVARLVRIHALLAKGHRVSEKNDL
jgi:hypothetical protein